MQPQVALQELLTRVLARQLTRNADEVQLLLHVPASIEQLSNMQQTLVSLRALHAHLGGTLQQLVRGPAKDPRLHALLPSTLAALEHVEMLHAEHTRACIAVAAALQQAALKLQAYASVNNGLVAELRMEGLGDKADSKAELAAIESATAVMAAAHLALLPPNQPPLQPQQPAAQAGPSEVQPATGRPNSQAQQLRLSQPQLQQTVPQYQVHMPQQQLHPLQQPSLTPTATPTASVPATWPGPQAAVPPPSHTLTEPATHQPASDWNLPHFTATPQHAHRQAAQHEANARALEVPSTVRPQVQQQPQSQGKLLTSHPISQPGTSNRDGPHPLQQPRLSQSPSTRARHPGSSEHSC